MRFIAGILVLAAYAPYLVWAGDGDISGSSLAEHRIVCKCDSNYKPVCGSNGITYSNECILNCVSQDHVLYRRPPILLMYPGVCRALYCKCPTTVRPVCGTNNQTYTNDCFLACENTRRAQANLPTIGLAKKGVCKQEYCRCPNSVIPVCGTDGKTYRNICIMQCYSRLNQLRGQPKIDLESSGACKKELCHCSKIKKQLCASDDNTYYNQCALDCQNRRRHQLGLGPLIVMYPGECNKCVCPANVDPVCASDNNTYPNYCSLLCENEKRNRFGLPDLVVLWHGSCNCGCNRKWKPVCASDRKTWGNRCLLDCENRRRERRNLPPLKVLYPGDCKSCNCDFCTIRYDPVCGSDRQVYRNRCFLDCNSNCLVASGRPPIWKISKKECNIIF